MVTFFAKVCKKSIPQYKAGLIVTNTVFQRFTVFILHTSNNTLISLRKIDLSHIFHRFILPWICPWFHDVSYMIHYSFFSPKIEKATFPNEFNLLIFYFRLKTKRFRRFYYVLKVQSCKYEKLLIFARVNFLD